MALTTTWEPWDGNGVIPQSVYAFPRQQLQPLTDALDVREAIESFYSYKAVTEEDRRQAFLNINKAAQHFHLDLHGDTYEEVSSRPQDLFAPRD